MLLQGTFSAFWTWHLNLFYCRWERKLCLSFHGMCFTTFCGKRFFWPPRKIFFSLFFCFLFSFMVMQCFINVACFFFSFACSFFNIHKCFAWLSVCSIWIWRRKNVKVFFCWLFSYQFVEIRLRTGVWRFIGYRKIEVWMRLDF